MTRVLDGAAPSLPPDVRATVVTVGTFDGVHRGHLHVLSRLVARARATGRPSLVLTFEPHPLEIVNPAAAPGLLTIKSEKLAALEELGIDYVVILPFTVELAQQSADAFVEEILRARFAMAELLIGHDHGFGRGRAGDVDTLRALGATRGFLVEVVAPVETDDGDVVSSSSIRRAISEGRLDDARDGLGREYIVHGVVEHGAGRGRTIGYRTLNVRTESSRKLLPADGVYAVRVDTPLGRYDAMLNLGARPTFGETGRTIEAHLFEASGDFYGAPVAVHFVRRLRDIQRFEDAEALAAQLRCDEADARRALTVAVEPG